MPTDISPRGVFTTQICFAQNLTPRCWATDTSFRLDAQLMVLLPNLGLQNLKITEIIHQQTKRTVGKDKKSLVLEDQFSGDDLFLYCLLCRLVSFLLTFWAKWIHHDLAEISSQHLSNQETQRIQDNGVDYGCMKHCPLLFGGWEGKPSIQEV